MNVYSLILHNDNINTVGYMSSCLQQILKIHHTNADQLVLITKLKSKSYVKNGTYNTLQPIRAAFNKLGLYTTIDVPYHHNKNKPD